MAYATLDERSWLKGKKQLVAQLLQIESTANRLRVSVDSLSAGLGHYLLSNVISEELGHPRSRAFLPLGLPRGTFSPSAQLRTAIDGVEALHRWAKAAAEAERKRIAARPPVNARARHTGDVGLNGFIQTIVEEGWVGVWGRRVADGPKLWKFVKAAAAGVGAGLSEEASRERIRRIFKRRRANQGRRDPNLPSRQPLANGRKRLGVTERV